MNFALQSSCEKSTVDEVTVILDTWSKDLVPDLDCLRINRTSLIISVTLPGCDTSMFTVNQVFAKHICHSPKQYELQVKGKDREGKNFEIMAHWKKEGDDKSKPIISLSLKSLGNN